MTGQSEKSHQNIGDEIVTQECRSDDPNDSDDLSLRSLRTDMQAFRRDRNWDQYHVPRNLLLALVGEVGELAELFQWRADPECAPGLPNWTKDERVHLGEELSDVLLYLVQLADVCDVDLPTVVRRKVGLNGHKYPPTPKTEHLTND